MSAPLKQILIRTDQASIYYKSGFADTDWTLIGVGSGGGGAGVNVQNQGVAIPNNPHSTLNFNGPGVTATDAGAGVAGIFIPGASEAANSVLTFRPGSAFTGPTVFNDWADLYAQLVALRTATDDSGRFTIVFDDADGACVIPPTAIYDMDLTEWLGVRWFADVENGQQVTVTIGDGTVNDALITNLRQITGLALVADQPTTPPLQLNGQIALTLIGTTISTAAGGDTVLEATGSCLIRLADESSFDVGASTALHVTSGTATIIIDGENAVIPPAAVSSTGGTALQGILQSSSGKFSPTQPGLVGTFGWLDSLVFRSGPAWAPIAPNNSGAINAATRIGYQIQVDGTGGPSTVSLPAAVLFQKGDSVVVKSVTDPVTITLNAAGADTIDGAATYDISGARAWVVLASNGVDGWNVIGQGPVAIYSPPEKWCQNEVAASQTDVDLSALVSVNFDTIKMIRSGSIVGLSSRFSENVSAGTATIAITKNGAAGTLAVVSTSVSNAGGGQSTQAPGIDTYVAGDEIGVQITTTGAFAPTTTDVEAWLQLFEQ